MKKRLSHIAPVIFLCFLLLPFLCMVVLQGAQGYLKSTAGERMQQHQLTTLSIPIGKAIWHKRDRELSIDGKLFDIKHYQVEGHLLHVTGYFDHEEMSVTRLLTLFLPGEKQSALLHFFLVLQCLIAPIAFIGFEWLYRPGRRVDSHFSFFLPLSFQFAEEHPPQC